MDRKSVILKIVDRDIRKLSLSTTDIQDKTPALYKAACKHFGDWLTALQYAGVPPHRAEDEYNDKNNVVRRLRARCVGKRSIHARTVQRTDNKLHKAALKHFGTWQAALIAAGINVDNVHPRQDRPRYTREQIVEKIKERHVQGLPIRYAEVALADWDLFRVVLSRFNSWKKVLAVAGIELKNDHKAKKSPPTFCHDEEELKTESKAKTIRSGKNRIRQLFLDRPGEVIACAEILTVCNSCYFSRRIHELRTEGMNIKSIKSDNGFIFYPDDGKENCSQVITLVKLLED